MRKLTFGLLIGLLMFSCGKNKNENTVSWMPSKLLPGKNARIYYNPRGTGALISNPRNMVCIVSLAFSDSTAVRVLPMERAGQKYLATVRIPETATMVSFKFEDDTGLTEDNRRRGWNIALQNKIGEQHQNSRVLLAKTFDGRSRPGTVPDFSQASVLYEAELADFPKNAAAWYGRWYCQLKKSDVPAGSIARIAQESDSLVTVFAGEPDFLKAAFDVNQVLLQDKKKAQILGKAFLTKYPEHREAENVALWVLKYDLSQDMDKNRNQLLRFKQKYPRFRDMLLINAALVQNYRQTGLIEQAIEVQLENVKMHPEDFREALVLARLYLQIGESKCAEAYLEQALALCTITQSCRDFPWTNGFERQIQWRIDRASLFSAKAELLFKNGDYRGSIDARKKAIAEGSPFPGYEYALIGRAFLTMNQPDSAKYPFVMALNQTPNSKGAINGLQQVFQVMNSGNQTFSKWLQQTVKDIRSKNQKLITDFHATAMDGDYFSLSATRGEIVVICFGATPLWEDESQLVELNRLARILEAEKNCEFWVFSIESKATLAAFLKQKDSHFKIVSDAIEIQKVLNIPGFPTYLVIDSKGIERFRQVGNSYRITEKLVAMTKQLNTEISGK